MAGIQIDGVNNKIDFDDDADTSISSATDDTLVIESGGVNIASITAGEFAINEGSADIDFRVESNGNANMLVVDGADNDVRIGTATSFGPHDAGLKVKGDITIGDFTNDSISATLGFIKSRNTTVGSQTIVADDDEIGRIAFRADDGNDANYNNNVAAISVQIDAAPGTDDTGGRILFETTADGARTTTERMRIDRSGHVLIGTSSPSNGQLEVESSTTNSFKGYFANSTANFSNLRLFSDVGGTETETLRIENDGDVKNTNNSYGSLSDERIKQDITDASSQWEDIKALKVKNFRRIDQVNSGLDNKMIGVIAQDLEAAGMSGLVKESIPGSGEIRANSVFGTDEKNLSGENVKSVKYSVLYMKAVKALQEAQTRIETLETKVAALEGN